MENEPQPVQQTVIVKGKTGFGPDQLKFPTPMWATWIFRVIFVLTTAATIWVAGTNIITSPEKVEIMLAFKSLDAIVWGLGKFVGISKDQIDQP